MQQKLETLNIPQLFLFAVLAVVLTGAVPLANELDLNLVVIAICTTAVAVKVVDDLTAAKIIIHELAKVDFKDDRLDLVLDRLDMWVNATGSQEPAQMATVTTTTVSGLVAGDLPQLPTDKQDESAG